MGAQDEIEIRPVREEDAPILATLLNEIIARGGTTALDEPLTASALADTMLTGPDVLCCFVAVERGTGLLLGFQSLERHDQLPDDRGDIATFARVGLTQKGVGGALFAATRQRARELGLTAINATIRSDNHGGLTFYSRMGFVDYDIQRAIPLKDGKLVDRIQKLYRLQDA